MATTPYNIARDAYAAHRRRYRNDPLGALLIDVQLVCVPCPSQCVREYHRQSFVAHDTRSVLTDLVIAPDGAAAESFGTLRGRHNHSLQR